MSACKLSDSGLAFGAKKEWPFQSGLNRGRVVFLLYIDRGNAASLEHSGRLGFPPEHTHQPGSNVPQLSDLSLLATMPEEQSGNPPLPAQSQSTSAPAPAPGAPAPSQSQPTARKKGTACFRCRSQKTRCDDRQPCSSCSKTGQNCIRPRTLDAERLVTSYHIHTVLCPHPPDSDPHPMEASS